jgi:long-chain acyl-CoA synthetase
MGCGVSTEIRRKFYNEYENQHCGLSGPFVHPSVENFKIVENKFLNKSLIEAISTKLKENPDASCMGYRKQINDNECEPFYSFLTNKQILSMSENFSKNLARNNLSIHKQFEDEGVYEFLGIFAKNCIEWIVTDIACQMNSVTTVTFYSTLGDQAFEHICKQTETSTICISPENIDILIKFKNQFGLETLENVILYDLTLQIFEKQKLQNLKSAGFNLYLFSDLIKQSDEACNLKISEPDTVLTICYTSGTTALPKGVQLTQRNFYAQLTTSVSASGFVPLKDDIHICYLPLAHVMERVLILFCLLYSIKAGMISGEVRKTLREDLQILKPTFLIAVPRILNTLRQAIFGEFEKVPAGCKKNLLNKALRIKKEQLLHSGIITHSLYDSLVFKKVREKFGGKIRLIITGSAPLPKDLADDIKILFSVPIVEAYGMTECCGAAVVTSMLDTSNTSAGGCFIASKIKLEDVPEMKYTSETKLNGQNSPSGEICIGGPIVFKGYFRNQEETRKMIDSDGWLHSGDVGRILPNDRGLKIFDRIKEIFKLSQGEYIAPSKLESVYSKSKYVMQICIYGDSQKNFVVGIIVPNKPALYEFLKNKIMDVNGVENFYNDKAVKEEVRADLERLAKENNFNSLEKVSNFILTGKEFTIDNGCLTPTMKLVRRKIETTFQEEISRMYEQS